MSDCCSGCSSNLANININGPAGIGIIGVNVDTVTSPGNSILTFQMSNGSSLTPNVTVPHGINGTNGQPVDHVSFYQSNIVPTNIPNKPGSIDTYRVWGDVGEIILLGSFTIYQGADNTVSDTITNTGAGSQIYKIGTDFPFELRSLISSNNTVSITQNTDNIDIKVVKSNWLVCSPLPTPGLPHFSNSPGAGFTSVDNVPGFSGLQFSINPITGKVDVRGTIHLLGGTGLAYSPTASGTSNVIHICDLPTNLIPTNALISTFTTASVYNSSNIQVLVSSGGLYLLHNRQFNRLFPGDWISFDNTSYSISPV